MAVRKLLRMGHPLLRQKAEPLVEAQIGTAWLDELVSDMKDTLADAGGIGLAAPQIGESYRLAIINIKGGTTRYGVLEPVPMCVYINPEIQVVDEVKQGFFEGCLSIPDLRGFVERPSAINVKYLNFVGDKVEETYKGFLATVFQHEFDHLDGRLYVDRMTDMSTLCFEPEFKQFIATAA